MSSTASDGLALRGYHQDWPPLPEPDHRPLHNAILTALGPLDGLRLLDAECGVGFLLQIAESAGALVCGVDPATELLEIARWALPDADLRVGGLGTGDGVLPFDNGRFDVVTAGTAMHEGADHDAVLAELVRVVRPGGRVAVGGWVRAAGCWADVFADRLRGLALLAPAGSDGAGLDGFLRAAGMDVLASGDVRFRSDCPDLATAWRAMLGSPQIMAAIRTAGVRVVHDAFRESVAPIMAGDGSVRLQKSIRYAIAAVPENTLFRHGHRVQSGG